MGDDYRRFVGEYNFDGARWGIEIVAKDWDEAQARMKAVGMGTIIGSDAVTIPVPGGSWVLRFWRWASALR